MRRNIQQRRYLLAACLAVGLTAALPASGRATEVKIRNFSNDNVIVAAAYGNGNGELMSQGWRTFKPGEEGVISAPDAADMHLRVRKAGREWTWSKYDTFRLFLATSSRYRVTMPSNAPQIRILRWGADLENDENIRKGSNGQFNPDDYPQGWSAQRFFRIGTGTHELKLAP